MREKQLTIKQEKFVLKYFECGNATEAYRHAYNAEKMKEETVTNKAHELLKHGEVAARLNELRASAKQESSWNVLRVLQTYTEVIEKGLGNKPIKKIVTEQVGDGMSQTLEVELCDTNLPAVNQAVSAIAKHLGMFKDKIEISGELSLKDFAKEFYLKTQGKSE